MPTSYSVIIPAYNEEKYIEKCVRSILDMTGKKPDEVIVVDNGSTDGTAAIAKSLGVTVVTEAAKGPNHARQSGLHATKKDIVCFVDADCIVPQNWSMQFLKKLEAEPETVCVSGPYHFYDGSAFLNFCTWMYWNCLAFPASACTGYMAVGGNLAIRRDVLIRAGGFDTSIAFYGDDTDVARRLKFFGVVRFDRKMIMCSSARRVQEYGMLRTGWTYACNFLSQVFVQKSVTQSHEDVRH